MKKARIASVNDFVVKFANINGSGSASANELFARAILRMGVPVSPRNIFPSNIQGLPTWYEVRVSEQGWLGRRGGVDLMVAMNPQTWDKDLEEIEPGGYLLYDSSKNVPAARLRSDINAIGVPLTEMCNARYRDARERQLLKNIIYVGVLAALLGIEPDVVAQLLGEQYKGKDKLVKPNLDAFMMGLHHGRQQLNDIVQLRIERRDAVGDRIFIDGNTAAAMGAVYGGATVCAWYPITPSSSLAEAFARLCGKYRVDAGGHARFAILQAEDELASIGIVIGAAWNGARAFTATSGPGISLMQEFLGLAYFAELPAVVIDVQRGGPSTGMPTRTQQSDLLLAAYASHGDTKHVLLFPEDPAECFEMTALAFDLADRLQTPVFVMSDLDIGMNTRLTAPLAWDDERRYYRGKVMTAEMLDAARDFGRHLDVDCDGIAYRNRHGSHPSQGTFLTRGTTRERYGLYRGVSHVYVDNMERLLRKFDTAATLLPKPQMQRAKRATRHGALFFGSTSAAMSEALTLLQAQGVPVDALRVRAFPFAAAVSDFIVSHEKVFVVEQNRDGQLRCLLLNELELDAARMIPVLHYDGTPITARFIAQAIGSHIGSEKVTPLKRAS